MVSVKKPTMARIILDFAFSASLHVRNSDAKNVAGELSMRRSDSDTMTYGGSGLTT